MYLWLDSAHFVFDLTWTWTNDLLKTCELTCSLDLWFVTWLGQKKVNLCTPLHFTDRDCAAGVCTAGFCSASCDTLEDTCTHGRTCLGGQCHVDCDEDMPCPDTNRQSCLNGVCVEKCEVSHVINRMSEFMWTICAFYDHLFEIVSSLYTDYWASVPQVCSDLPTNWEQIGAVNGSLALKAPIFLSLRTETDLRF